MTVMTRATRGVQILEQHSFQTLAARDAGEALDAARRDKPDLVVSDAALAMEGEGLCAAVRRDRVIAKVPILLISSTHGEPPVAASLQAGADDSLVDPVDPQLLVARVRALLTRRTLELQLAEANAELASRSRSRAPAGGGFRPRPGCDADCGRWRAVRRGQPAACALLGLTRDGVDRTQRRPTSSTPTSTSRRNGPSAPREGLGPGKWVSSGRAAARFRAEFAARANIVPGRHLWTLRDVTERKRLEEHMRQAQRLEAVGRLAGGIAHDFNNLLTAILGLRRAADRGAADDDSAARRSPKSQAGERAAALTRQLLAFSRARCCSPTVLDLNEPLVENVRPHAAAADRRAHRARRSRCDGLPPVGPIRASSSR